MMEAEVGVMMQLEGGNKSRKVGALKKLEKARDFWLFL